MPFFSFLALTSVLAATSQATCSHSTHHYDARSVESFGYTGLNGPLNWLSLNHTANTACAKGRRQTPINLDENTVTEPANRYVLDLPHHSNQVRFENLGTTVQVHGEGINGTFQFSRTGKSYELRQFHFHTPSEHRINDEYFPLEVHFVHVDPKDNATLVLGYLVEMGKHNDPFIDSVLTQIDKVPNRGDTVDISSVDFGVVKASLHHNPVYRYTGSLTTPPCSEDISWVLSTKPLTICYKTFNKAKKVLKFNSRYTQNSIGDMNLLENAAKDLDP